MTQTSHAHPFTAPIQQCWSDGIAMALAGTEAIQAQGKMLVESAVELASASTKANLKCAEDITARVTAAAQQGEALFREQVAVLNDLPSDPVGASQRMVANYVEGSRKSLDLGAKALTGWAALMSDAWMRAGKLGQEAGQACIACATRLQEISAARTKE